MIIILLAIALEAYATSSTNCEVRDNTIMNCIEGECQYKIFNDFNYENKNLNTKGDKTAWGGTIYCPMIIESNSTFRGNNIFRDFERVEVKENVNAIFASGAYSVYKQFVFHKGSFVYLEARFCNAINYKYYR